MAAASCHPSVGTMEMGSWSLATKLLQRHHRHVQNRFGRRPVVRGMRAPQVAVLAQSWVPILPNTCGRTTSRPILRNLRNRGVPPHSKRACNHHRASVPSSQGLQALRSEPLCSNTGRMVVLEAPSYSVDECPRQGYHEEIAKLEIFAFCYGISCATGNGTCVPGPNGK